MITIISILAAILYILLGCIVCKKWIDITNNNIANRRHITVNKTLRLLKRLSIILLYPLYGIGLAVMYMVELLTEDYPFE